jgi:hypothetical protein
VIDPAPLRDLEPRELDALCDAAVWYAKYRAADIAERSDDRSATAVVAREEYLDLITALRKLGVRIRVPDALSQHVANAA